MKQVLIVSTSLRAGSNSDFLAKEFGQRRARGRKRSGVPASCRQADRLLYRVPCCQKTKKCVIRDDAVEIAEKVKNAHTLVFATRFTTMKCAGR